MKCRYCGKELEKAYWVGPKNLNLCFCDMDCSSLDTIKRYPNMLSKETNQKILLEICKRKKLNYEQLKLV